MPEPTCGHFMSCGCNHKPEEDTEPCCVCGQPNDRIDEGASVCTDCARHGREGYLPHREEAGE